MPTMPIAQELGPPPRRVRLTRLGKFFRTAPWVFLLLLLVTVLVLVFFKRGQGKPVEWSPVVIFVLAAMGVYVAALFGLSELAIAVEARRARTLAAADVVWAK